MIVPELFKTYSIDENSHKLCEKLQYYEGAVSRL